MPSYHIHHVNGANDGANGADYVDGADGADGAGTIVIHTVLTVEGAGASSPSPSLRQCWSVVATSEQQPNPLRCRPQSGLVLIIIIIIMVMVTMVIISSNHCQHHNYQNGIKIPSLESEVKLVKKQSKVFFRKVHSQQLLMYFLSQNKAEQLKIKDNSSAIIGDKYEVWMQYCAGVRVVTPPKTTGTNAFLFLHN